MEVIVHKQIDALEKIYPKWRQLKEEFLEVTVFQDISWQYSWWQYEKAKKDITPYILEIQSRDETIGIIPLYCSIKQFASLSFRVLRPIGSILSDYLVPILSKRYCPEKLLNKAFEKIYEDKASWDFIDWNDLPEQSIFDQIFMNKLMEKYSLERKRTFICPFLILDNDFEQVRRKYDQKLLKEIIKKEKRLKRIGELQYCKVTKENEIEPIMNIFFDLHCQRWSNTDSPSRYEIKEERDYSLKVAKRLYENQLLHLSYLKCNDDITAVEFAMFDNEKIYLYLTAFNNQYKKYSVGNILLYHLILDACKQGFEIVDFTRGGEEYKQQWGTEDKFNVVYTFHNDTIKSTLYKMIMQTYYSKQFKEKSIVKRVVTKSLIRGSAYILSMIDRLRLKKVQNSLYVR